MGMSAQRAAYLRKHPEDATPEELAEDQTRSTVIIPQPQPTGPSPEDVANQAKKAADAAAFAGNSASMLKVSNPFAAAPKPKTAAEVARDKGIADEAASRERNERFLNSLEAQANGTGGPSTAQLELQQATEANARSAQGAIAGQRGLNAGVASRMILDQRANANQASAGQAAMLRQREMQDAQRQLGAGISGQRGQDQSGGLGYGRLDQGQQGIDTEAQRYAEAQRKAAHDKNAGLAGGIGGAIGTGLGALIGGPGGAAIGGELGKGIGSAGYDEASGYSQGGEVEAPSDLHAEHVKFLKALTEHGKAKKMSGGGKVPAEGFQRPKTWEEQEGEDWRKKTLFNAELAEEASNTPQAKNKPWVSSDGGKSFKRDRGMAHGGVVDDPSNDTVPAMLSPGEVVLPVSVAQSPDAAAKAAAFVAHLKNQGMVRPPAPKSYGEALQPAGRRR